MSRRLCAILGVSPPCTSTYPACVSNASGPSARSSVCELSSGVPFLPLDSTLSGSTIHSLLHLVPSLFHHSLSYPELRSCARIIFSQSQPVSFFCLTKTGQCLGSAATFSTTILMLPLSACIFLFLSLFANLGLLHRTHKGLATG